MNGLSPEARRGKADEIARLLETEPLLAFELGAVASPTTRKILSANGITGAVHPAYLSGKKLEPGHS